MEKVLVVVVLTSFERSFAPLWPRLFDVLDYRNKSLALLDETFYPQISRQATFEGKIAAGREIGVEMAKRGGFDFVLFLGARIEPPAKAIEVLLSAKAAIAGGLVADPANSGRALAWNYENRQNLRPVYPKRSFLFSDPSLDYVSGDCLLCALRVFDRVNFSDYIGPISIPGRWTSADEFFLLKIYQSFKIRPKLVSSCRPWRYDLDGRAHRFYGEVKQWQ